MSKEKKLTIKDLKSIDFDSFKEFKQLDTENFETRDFIRLYNLVKKMADKYFQPFGDITTKNAEGNSSNIENPTTHQNFFSITENTTNPEGNSSTVEITTNPKEHSPTGDIPENSKKLFLQSIKKLSSYGLRFSNDSNFLKKLPDSLANEVKNEVNKEIETTPLNLTLLSQVINAVTKVTQNITANFSSINKLSDQTPPSITETPSNSQNIDLIDPKNPKKINQKINLRRDSGPDTPKTPRTRTLS